MIKNGSKEFKQKLGFLLIVILAVLGKVLFETIGNGMVSPQNIILAVAAGVAFSAYIIGVLTEKAFNSFTVQGVFAVMTLLLTLGVVISYSLISDYILYSVLLASVMILLSQRFYLLPVAAVIGVFVSFLETRPEIHATAMSVVPAAIGVSCVCLSDEIKNSAIWKKLVFAAAELLMIASTVKVFMIFRYTVTVHSFKVEIWDSIASFIAIAVLFVLAVYTIKLKKSVGEVFGCVAVAAFGIVPTFMDMKYVFVSAMTMLMMITACSKEGTAADALFGTAIKSAASKLKK